MFIVVWTVSYQADIFHFNVTLISLAASSFIVFQYIFFPGLVYCQSARRKGEAEMWGIINRIGQAASSRLCSRCLADKRSVRVTCVVSVFSLFVSLVSLFLFLEIIGSWSGTAKTAHKGPQSLILA